jgi:type IV secretion system protein VirB10
MARLKALQEALMSKPPIESPNGPKATTSDSSPSNDDRSLQKLAMLRSMLPQQPSIGSPAPTPADITGLNQFDAPPATPTVPSTSSGSPLASLSAGKKADRWKSYSDIENPSRFTFRAGSIVPGVLVSGINSELPGTIIAQVSQNVYDTATGQYLLIPQGTKLLGAYASNVANGQDRLFIAWQRITYPDGRVLDIGSQPGTDGGGYAGFSDQVDNHYAKIFGSAVMMSAIVGGVAYSQDMAQSKSSSTNGNDNTLSGSMSQALGNVFGNVIAKMIEKNLNIAPTIKIRPGYRFNILVVKDFDLVPYQPFQYRLPANH